jgi:uncharacterized DUF497 family protein
VTFDWDDANRQHLSRHGIEPVEAEEVMQNSPYELDVQMEHAEERIRYIGETLRTRVLIVVITFRGDRLRVVTAWDAPRAEKSMYLRERVAELGQTD